MDCRLSVILPTFNGAAYWARAIWSVWRSEDVTNLLKLVPHWLVRRFTARPAGPSLPAAEPE
jgi:hypothetical protein